jgi:imidazolonepropionase-like amidohydrolase
VLAASARDDERFPASINGQIQMLSNLFDGKPAQSSVYVTSLIDRSIQAEKIQNVEAIKSGDRKTIFSANSYLEINAAIGLARQNELDAVLLSSGRVGELAEKLAGQKFGLIVPDLDSHEYQSQLDQFVSANRAGVPIAFAGESPEKIRVTAALLTSAGLPPEAALQGLTAGGAALVGMKNVNLAKNAPADFVVWSGSPLNLSAKPVHVVVDGQIVPTK